MCSCYNGVDFEIYSQNQNFSSSYPTEKKQPISFSYKGVSNSLRTVIVYLLNMESKSALECLKSGRTPRWSGVRWQSRKACNF